MTTMDEKYLFCQGLGASRGGSCFWIPEVMKGIIWQETGSTRDWISFTFLTESLEFNQGTPPCWPNPV